MRKNRSGPWREMRDCVERVCGRVPGPWRIDRAEGAQRVAARGGELVALSADLSLSTRYSISCP